MNSGRVRVGDRGGDRVNRIRPGPERVFQFFPHTRPETRIFGGNPTLTGRGRVGGGSGRIGLPSLLTSFTYLKIIIGIINKIGNIQMSIIINVHKIGFSWFLLLLVFRFFCDIWPVDARYSSTRCLEVRQTRAQCPLEPQRKQMSV